MSPDEILQDLRDIHLPAETAEAVGSGLVLWPILSVIAIALIATLIAWRRRSAWTKDFHCELDLIEALASDGQTLNGWTKLAVLLRRTAIQLSSRREIAGLAGDAWLRKLDFLFTTNAFSKGPGRGVIRFPYRRPIGIKKDELAPIADQLRAIIGHLRLKTPKRVRL